MNRMYRVTLFTLIVLCLLAFTAKGQTVSFVAKANAKQVVLGNHFEVSFILTNANGNGFQAPLFKDFKQVSGKNVRTNASAINGKWERSTTFSYYLQPKKKGTLRIGSAVIRVDGKVYKTKPLQIEVVEGKQKTDGEVEQIFAKAVLSTNEAVAGQQVILDYKVYFAVNIDRYGIVEEPSFSGLFVSQIRRFNGQVIKEVIDGVQYGTKIIKRLAIYPQQSGQLTIDPITIRVAVPINDNSPTSPFTLLRPTQSFILETEPVVLDVKPLPEPVPTSFSGAVGSYTATAVLDKTRATTDDAITLSLTVSGDGDIKRVTAPELILSDTFEVYDPNTKAENEGERNGALFGGKTFEYLILPKIPGAYEIAPEFSYFDPDSSKFVILKPARFQVNIRQGKNNTNVNVKPVEPEKPKEEIRFIKTTASLKSLSGFVGSLPFWLCIILPFLILGGAASYRYVQSKKPPVDPIAEKSRLAMKVAKNRLSGAEEFLKGKNLRSFYDETSKALLGYVIDKFNIPGSELTKSNVKSKLEQSGANGEHISRFMEIIGTCERAVYAGGTDGDARKVYNDAINVIADIEM